MGTRSLAYLALLAYPFITLLVYEPNELRWWWRTGGGVPMPPEIMERSKQNEGNLLLFKFALLTIASFFLLRGGLGSAASLGLRLRQPTGTVLMGVIAGILLAVEGAFLAALFLWSRTLVTPFIAHVLLNSTAALMQRKRALVKQDSKASDLPG